MKIKQRSRKQSFRLRLRFRRLRSSENWVVGVGSRSGRAKPIQKRGNEHCDWFTLLLLLPTPTIWFSLDRKRRNRKRSRKKMETFWFFRLRFRRAYDSTYDSDFWFSLGHKRSYDPAYDSDSDSVASENQPLTSVIRKQPGSCQVYQKKNRTTLPDSEISSLQMKWSNNHLTNSIQKFNRLDCKQSKRLNRK